MSKFPIKLTQAEKDLARALVTKYSHKPYIAVRGEILLAADEGLSDHELIERFGKTMTTIHHIRHRFFEAGVDFAIVKKVVPRRNTTFDNISPETGRQLTTAPNRSFHSYG